jgi:hypothetical protein
VKKRKTAVSAVSSSAPIARVQSALAAPLLHTHLTLVETAEPDLLEELLADRRVGPLLVARLSDCVAVVAPGNAKEVQRWLLKAGHTPRIIGGEAARKG